jgi:hypothetical protein
MAYQEKYLKYKNKYLALKNQSGGYNDIYLEIFNNIFKEIDNTNIFARYRKYYDENILPLIKDNSSLVKILQAIEEAQNAYNLFRYRLMETGEFKEGTNPIPKKITSPRVFVDAYETLYKIFSVLKSNVNLSVKISNKPAINYKQGSLLIDIDSNDYSNERNKINSIIDVISMKNEYDIIEENVYYTIFLWYIKKLMHGPDFIKNNNFIFPYISPVACEILNMYSSKYYYIILFELEYNRITDIRRLLKTISKISSIKDKITSFAQKLMFENNHSYYNCSNYNIDYDCERNNCKINDVKGFLSNTKTCVSK